jgi:hypothetical protein
MSNFRHWATDSLRDKLQTLPIFVFILYQNGQTQWYLYCEPKHQSSRLTLLRGFGIEVFYSSLFFFLGLNVFVWL